MELGKDSDTYEKRVRGNDNTRFQSFDLLSTYDIQDPVPFIWYQFVLVPLGNLKQLKAPTPLPTYGSDAEAAFDDSCQ